VKPVKEWDMPFANVYVGANQIQQTNDGGYIVAGWSKNRTSGNLDAYLVKLFANGTQEWPSPRTFHYRESENNVARSVQQIKDGGYILAGYTERYGLGTDVLLIKTDAYGNVTTPPATWMKAFGSPNDEVDEAAHSVLQRPEGGYVAVGTKANVSYIVTTDEDGNGTWYKIPYDLENQLDAVVPDHNRNGYYFAVGRAYTNLTDSWDVYVYPFTVEKVDGKLEVNGTWNQTQAQLYGKQDDEIGFDIKNTKDGYVIFGVRGKAAGGSAGEKSYALMINIDDKGVLQKYVPRELRINDNNYTDAYAGNTTTDGGYVIAGDTYPDENSTHTAFILKTDKDGTAEWNYTAPVEENSTFYSVQQTKDGGFICAGVRDWQRTNSSQTDEEFGDMYVVKLGRDAPSPQEQFQSWIVTAALGNEGGPKIIAGIITGISVSVFGMGISKLIQRRRDQ
jgi:hypothetical protein